MNDFAKFVDWGFSAFISGATGLCVMVLWRIAGSITTLKVQMSAILEKIAGHEKAIDKLEQRTHKLESYL